MSRHTKAVLMIVTLYTFLRRCINLKHSLRFMTLTRLNVGIKGNAIRRFLFIIVYDPLQVNCMQLFADVLNFM
jgi:hypothetical protein